MARLARLVLPEWPHHVIQRGVRSMALFASDADRQLSLRLLAQFCQREGVTAWDRGLAEGPLAQGAGNVLIYPVP